MLYECQEVSKQFIVLIAICGIDLSLSLSVYKNISPHFQIQLSVQHVHRTLPFLLKLSKPTVLW